MLTILIPTYNRNTLLARCLDSLICQSDPDFDVLIIDDASAIPAQEVVEMYAGRLRITYIEQEKNMGVNAARNRGFRMAHGEWIACLDDDDLFVPEAVASIKKTIKTTLDHVSVLYFNSRIVKDDTTHIGGFQFTENQEYYDPTYYDTMTKRNLKGDCKPVFRKNLFTEKKYTFPESVNGFESYTMNLLARDGVGIRYHKTETTIVHFTKETTHLSTTAPRKNPLPLLQLHLRQLAQHSRFYFIHPAILNKKIVTMAKLVCRVLF